MKLKNFFRLIEEAGGNPLYNVEARKALKNVKKILGNDFNTRLELVAQYLSDIQGKFWKYKNFISPTILLDKEVFSYIEELLPSTKVTYNIDYAPTLLPEVLRCVRSRDITLGKQILNKPRGFGTLLKAYEMLKLGEDDFLKTMKEVYYETTTV